jgi:hypothetical protein
MPPAPAALELVQQTTTPVALLHVCVVLPLYTL